MTQRARCALCPPSLFHALFSVSRMASLPTCALFRNSHCGPVTFLVEKQVDRPHFRHDSPLKQSRANRLRRPNVRSGHAARTGPVSRRFECLGLLLAGDAVIRERAEHLQLRSLSKKCGHEQLTTERVDQSEISADGQPNSNAAAELGRSKVWSGHDARTSPPPGGVISQFENNCRTHPTRPSSPKSGVPGEEERRSPSKIKRVRDSALREVEPAGERVGASDRFGRTGSRGIAPGAPGH
jgi:hypothetical protein